MFSDLRAQLEGAGVSVPQKGTLTLYHAGCAAKLRTIETTLEVPGSEEADGKLRVYVATSPKIAEVIPHADGVVAIEVDLDLPLELGMGRSQAWVELVYEVPQGQAGMPVVSASRP